jgi:hypothetical protein
MYENINLSAETQFIEEGEVALMLEPHGVNIAAAHDIIKVFKLVGFLSHLCGILFKNIY